MQKTRLKAADKPSAVRRPPMLRSAYWAFLIGAIGGAILGVG